MGLLQKLFGRKSAGVSTPSGAGGRISLHKLAMMQNVGVSTKRCDICGSTFASPDRILDVISDDIQNRYSLDVGGYCAQCGKHMCQRHAKFVKTGGLGPLPVYEVGCGTCGSPLK